MEANCVTACLVILFLNLDQLQGTIRKYVFTPLDKGHSVMVNFFQQDIAESSLHCSFKCARDLQCFGNQYRERKCTIIHTSITQGETFVSSGSGAIYILQGKQVKNEFSSSPNNWAGGDQPAVYWSFDTDNDLELINGASIAPGQISSMALNLNKSEEQWASLGDLSSVTCLPVPNTCGPEDASLSVWLKIEDCGQNGTDGFISSLFHGSNGFRIRCEYGKLRCSVAIGTGYFHKELDVPFGWFHLALVFHGPDNGQGFTLHIDDNSWTDSTLISTSGSERNSSGVVVLGKSMVDRNRNFGSLMVDELTFWNRQLSEAEVAKLRNMNSL